MSDIRILKNAKNVDDLDKWALKYVKKYNLNKDSILKNIIKEIESGKKINRVLGWSLLLVLVYNAFYFTSKNPGTIHLGQKTIFIGSDDILILNSIMILCVLSILCVFLICNLIQKRKDVAKEQFSRLFKEGVN
jgi:hypothetical protein